jgi:hypothetical protein
MMSLIFFFFAQTLVNVLGNVEAWKYLRELLAHCGWTYTMIFITKEIEIKNKS